MDKSCPIEASLLACSRSEFVDDDQIYTENISSPTPAIASPVRVVEPVASSDDVTGEMSKVLTPVQNARISGETFDNTTPILVEVRDASVDDDQIQTENISSLTPQIVSPLRVVEPVAALDDVSREMSMVPTPFQNVEISGDTFDTTTPIVVEVRDASDIADGGPTSLPTKRGRGRPKGSKNISSRRVVEPLAALDDETPLDATPLQAIFPSGDEAFTPTSPIFVEPQQSPRQYEANNADAGSSSVPIKRGRGRPKGSKSLTTTAKKQKVYNPRVLTSCPNFDLGITEEGKETGNQDLVDLVLMRFDAVRRRLCQLNLGKSVLTTSLTNCIKSGSRTNSKKRIGPIPGVQVGDIFYFRDEMLLVGLHKQTVTGIDYLTGNDGAIDDHLATSVVTSGHYDEAVDLYKLIYTGQGGTEKNGQARSHKLKGGNLALETSRMKGNEVRVIRGVEDPHNKNKMIYIYDGLYLVDGFSTVKGRNNVDEFKFEMKRKPHQLSGYETWILAERLRKECSFSNMRKGFVLEDISSGNEHLPVAVLNEIDEDGRSPEAFEYVRSKYDSNTTLELQIVPYNASCIGIQKNGGELPYLGNILVCRKPMIYECGDSCPSLNNCNNRVVHTGLKIRLEVFKTENCGWGLRSWEPIRAGTFICEFVGLKKTREEVEEEDEYLFDTSRIYKQFKWNYEPELVGEQVWERVSEVFKIPSPVLISAKQQGNVARFMNHSCSPNVFWQPIELEKEGELHIRIGFFAMKHIPPLTELTYDYGGSYVEEIGEDETLIKGKKTCLCGSLNCRGSFG